MYTRRAWIIGVGSAGLAAVLPPARGLDWPQFRGPDRNGISKETGLLRKWPAAGPKLLWSVPVAEGYAGAAIVGGRVYHHDYDEAKSEWSINCRSLAAGKPIWQFREPREIRPNHAITRTIPAVDGRFVCSLDPKAVLHCLDARTGKQIWRKSLVTEYQATIPSWYNGQCPLQEAGRIVVATGGAAILVALDKATGKEIWRTPNPNQRLMTHASVMPAVLGGVRQYLYGTLQGPLGVSAADGKLLWEFGRKFNVAVAPSPIAVDQERVFMTASYDAGSVMIRVRRDGGAFKTEPVRPEEQRVEFGSAHADRAPGPSVRGGQEEARPVHLPGFRGQGGLDQRRESLVRSGQLHAGRRHVSGDGWQHRQTAPDRGRAPRHTTRSPARRFWRGRKCGRRWRCRTASWSCAI
jgi:hypothetical protein